MRGEEKIAHINEKYREILLIIVFSGLFTIYLSYVLSLQRFIFLFALGIVILVLGIGCLIANHLTLGKLPVITENPLFYALLLILINSTAWVFFRIPVAISTSMVSSMLFYLAFIRK